MSLTTTRKGTKATAAVTVPSLTERWRSAQEKVSTAERLFVTAQLRRAVLPGDESNEAVAVAVELLIEAQNAEAIARSEFAAGLGERMQLALDRGADPLRVRGLPR